MHKETVCVHAGTYYHTETGGVNTPIFTSSSYNYIDREDVPYPRYFNTLNQQVVVRKVCDLEGAEDGVLFSSGMAAMSTALLAFAGSGDHVVLLDALYGGTHSLATDELERLGIRYDFTATDAAAVAAAITPATKAIVIESPTNPLLEIIDIPQVAEAAAARGVITIIDNTFATPINQTPLAMGIDVVVHSGTKYLGGHSDLCCGIAVSSRRHARRIRATARHLGGSLDAQACYLLERSLKTLALRVNQQSRNAMRIAEFLNSQPAVARVNYPGLESAAGHPIAKAQMRDFGAMLSFELDPARIDTRGFLQRLEYIHPAVSLGGVETIICSPAQTSHSTISPEARKRIGISDNLLRLSVGIEHADDLIADLTRALV